jgi:aminopeptidase N
VRNPFSQTFFSDVLDAHEVAHQWWGNLVSTKGYQDDWIMEAMADYSALMYLEKKKGVHAVDSVLDRYREHLLDKSPDGQTIESSGPITWGIRLISSHSPESWRVITYEKGAWIIHMMRKRLGDERFMSMLREICETYRFRAITTEEFREAAQRFAAPKSPDADFRMFFENWVFGTGIPTVKLTSSVHGAKITGSLTTSNVAEDFNALIPVEVQQGKQKTLHWLHASSDGTPFTINIGHPAPGVKVNLAMLDGLILKK